jgi:hypothetical protein
MATYTITNRTALSAFPAWTPTKSPRPYIYNGYGILVVTAQELRAGIKPTHALAEGRKALTGLISARRDRRHSIICLSEVLGVSPRPSRAPSEEVERCGVAAPHGGGRE